MYYYITLGYTKTNKYPVSALVPSIAVRGIVDSLFIVAPFVCRDSVFDACFVLLCITWCLVGVLWLFFTVPWVGLRCESVVFSDHSNLLIWFQTWAKKGLAICISRICVPFQIALIRTTGLFMRYHLLGPEEAV